MISYKKQQYGLLALIVFAVFFILSSKALAATVPGAPTGLTATPGNAQVSLSWTAPSSTGGSPLTNYLVDYQLTSTSTWTQFGLPTSTSTTATVTGLTNGSAYNFEVYAVNAIGTSASSSNMVTATPIYYSTAGEITSINLAPTGGSSMPNDFSYTASSIPAGTQIEIQFSNDGVSWYNSTGAQNQFTVLSAGTNTIDLSDLGWNGTNFFYRVLFVSTGGATPVLNNISVLFGFVPFGSYYTYSSTGTLVSNDLLQGNQVYAVSTSTFYISSLPPNTGVSVQFSQDDINWSTSTALSAGTSTISLSSLGWASPQHFYYRAAFTSNGTYTPILNLVSLTYLITVPNAPTGLTATSGNGQATLSWTAPTNTGGSPLTNYLVDYQLTSTSTWTQFGLPVSTSTSATVTGLTNGSAYNFEVYAVNSVGTSASSSNIAAATPATVPSAPMIGTATGGNAQATVSFATSTNGGSAILYYTAISNVGGFSATSTGSPITVTGLTNGTSYTFTVTATNGVGTSAASAASNSVTPATSAGSPILNSATSGNAQVALSWTAPSSTGGSGITQYLVYDRMTGSGSFSLYATTTLSQTTSTVSSLTNGQSYDFEIVAQNGVGTSTPSNILSATPATVPNAPTGLTATSGNGQATLSWTAPTNTGGSPLTDYFIDYQPTSTSTWSQFDVGSTSTSATVAGVGLVNGTAYNFEVYAVNAVGTSASSSNMVTATPATVPSAPMIGTATGGNAQATISFTASSTGGSSILYFTATANSGGFSATSTGSPITVTGLVNGTPYTFTVTATNGMGTSVASAASNSVTPATVPDAPTAISATAGNAQVSLLWSAPAYDGGSPIINYVVEYEPTASSSWSVFAEGTSTATSTIVTGLTNGTPYNFEVSAVNSAGQGNPSGIVSATPITVPDAPTSITAIGGNAEATVSFAAPDTDGGSTITTYTVTGSPSGIGTGTSSPITVTGLTNGTAYTFTVTATNAAGTGATSTSSSPVTPATVPNAPTSPSATSSNAKATVTFTPPANNGGATVLYYTAISNPDNISATSTGDSISVTGLTNGTPYTFTVTATNDVGTGSPSVATNSVTPMTVPDAPVIGTATAGNVQATISFTAPDTDGGSPITGYTVTSNPGGFTGTGTASPITVTGLTNGTAYTFTVTATNSVGTGAASVASNSATPVTVPDPPINLTPTAGNAQVALSWTTPANNGGSAITDYVMEYELTGSGSWSVFAEGTSTATNGTVTGLVNGTSYDFEVAAVNVAGQGSPSASVTAVPVTVPDAPTNASATGGNAQATVTFNVPDTNGGSPITGYTITSNPGGFTGTGTSSPIIVAGLTNGTSYTFTVTATNAVGTGAASSPSNSVIPATVPGAPISVSAVAGNTQATISFTAPSNTGGSPITSYTVTDNTDTYTATGTGSPITVTGLTNGDTYSFTVTATNAVGTGTASTPSNSVTLSTQPSAPLNLAATVEESSIGLSWSPPASDGGSPVTNYVVEYELTTGGTWSVFANGVSTSTTAIVTGLSDRTSYNFEVSAVNAIGQSSPSAPVTAIPGEPAQVLIQNFSNLTAPNIGTAVRITNEGSVDYEYQYTWCITASPGVPCNSDSDVFSATAAKLIKAGTNFDTVLTSTVPTPGNYWFTIIASYGSASSTATQSFTAVATYPDAPTSVSATAGNAQATVSFNVPDTNGGSPITGYTVTSNPSGITATGTASPITVTGLTNGTAYTFTVTATNAVGTGTASTPSTSVTPATVPNPPTAVSALAGNGEVTLSWLPPSSDGGSPITNYVVEYKLSSDSNWAVFATPVSTATTATVTGLTNNVSYDFEVSAVNAIGQSIVNSASATLPPNAPVYSSGGGGGGSSIYYYFISASAAPNGSINPSGSVVLTQGSGQTFTITPAAGYQVANVFVDNNSVGAVKTYTFNDVAGNHTISAVFSPTGAPVTVATTTPTVPPVSPTEPGKITPKPPKTNKNGMPPTASSTLPNTNNGGAPSTVPVTAPTSTKINGNQVSATPTAASTPSSTPSVTVERSGEWVLWVLVAILAFGGLFIFLVYRRRRKQKQELSDKETEI